MKKNKVISIFLLIITILLSIGVGLCFSKPETKPNNKQTESLTIMEEQYLTFINTQYLMRFTYLLSNDPTDIKVNIYTVLTEMPYYQKYLQYINYPLSPADGSQYYPLAQFLYPSQNENNNTYSPLNNEVQLARLPYINPFIMLKPVNLNTDTTESAMSIKYNIKNDETFQYFINTLYLTNTKSYGPLIPHSDLNINSQNYMTNLVKHYQTFHPNYLTCIDDEFSANMLELLEILYVSTIVPASLYSIYVLPYNYALEKYPQTFTDSEMIESDCISSVLCNTNSYTMFIQLYQSAMQMNLALNKLIDISGNPVIGVDYTNSKLSDIHNHIDSIMYMFDGKDVKYTSDLVQGLEPSYILFYNALYFFHKKFNP